MAYITWHDSDVVSSNEARSITCRFIDSDEFVVSYCEYVNDFPLTNVVQSALYSISGTSITKEYSGSPFGGIERMFELKKDLDCAKIDDDFFLLIARAGQFAQNQIYAVSWDGLGYNASLLHDTTSNTEAGSCCRLATNLVIWAYFSITTNTTYFRAGYYTDSWALGDIVGQATDANMENTALTAAGSNKFVYWGEQNGGKLIVGTVTGTTITLNATQYTCVGDAYPSACYMADDKIIVCVTSGGAGKVYAVTLSGDVPTVGTAFEFAAPVINCVVCGTNDANYFVVAYADVADGNKGKTQLCQVDWTDRSITSVGAETFTQVSVGGGTDFGMYCDIDGNNNIIIAYQDDDNNDYATVKYGVLPSDLSEGWRYWIGPDGDNLIEMFPNWDYRAGDIQHAAKQRTGSGRGYIRKFYDYKQISFTTDFVNGSHASIVNSWWDSGSTLIWRITNKGATISEDSVLLMNKLAPFGELNKSYGDVHKGRILLEGYT